MECYKDSPIITLGEPVLRLLTNEGEKVRDYWNFQERGYKYLSPDNNILRRYIFPFPHQPSMRKLLYNSNFKDYIKYMKDLF